MLIHSTDGREFCSGATECGSRPVAESDRINKLFTSIEVGNYKVEIQAAVNADATVSGLGTAIGGAAYGLGSVTVESVRLVHDFSF